MQRSLRLEFKHLSSRGGLSTTTRGELYGGSWRLSAGATVVDLNGEVVLTETFSGETGLGLSLLVGRVSPGGRLLGHMGGWEVTESGVLRFRTVRVHTEMALLVVGLRERFLELVLNQQLVSLETHFLSSFV